MQKSHKLLTIQKAEGLGFQRSIDISIKAEYKNALHYIIEHSDLTGWSRIEANRIVHHSIGNVYIDYVLPLRGKEWYQGDITYFEKSGYIHIAVDDDLRTYVIYQDSEDLF